MKRLLTLFIWFPAALLTIFISFLFYIYRLQDLYQQTQQIKSINAFTRFLPSVLGLSATPEDNTTESVKKYLNKYKSPMKESTPALVQWAREYDVDPFLILAIAQCETNLGKKSPENCFNAFGLGIYGDKKLCFEDWDDGFRFMAKTLRQKYHDQDLYTPEEIMEKYCPTSIEKSDGHWAKCVNRFHEEASNIGL